MAPKSGSSQPGKNQRGIASFFKSPRASAAPPSPVVAPQVTTQSPPPAPAQSPVPVKENAQPGAKRKVTDSPSSTSEAKPAKKRANAKAPAPKAPAPRKAEPVIVVEDGPAAEVPDAVDQGTTSESRPRQAVTALLTRDPQRHAKAKRKLATIRTGRLAVNGDDDRQAQLEKSGTKYTPLEQQVVELKKRNPGVLLLVEVRAPLYTGGYGLSHQAVSSHVTRHHLLPDLQHLSNEVRTRASCTL